MAKMGELGLVLGAIKGAEMELSEAAFKTADAEFDTAAICLKMAKEWLSQAGVSLQQLQAAVSK